MGGEEVWVLLESFQGQLAFVIATHLNIVIWRGREMLSVLEREKDVVCIY